MRILKGVAEVATRLLLDKAFGEWGLNKVYLNVLESNLRAIRFYEKCGFKREGLLKEHIYKDGILANLCLYGMLKYDYDKRSKK